MLRTICPRTHESARRGGGGRRCAHHWGCLLADVGRLGRSTRLATLSDAQSTADYGTVADKYAATKVAPWARLREGEAELSSGIRLFFTDREAGRSRPEKGRRELRKAHQRQANARRGSRAGSVWPRAMPRIDAVQKTRALGRSTIRPSKPTNACSSNFPIRVYKESRRSSGSPPSGPERLRISTPGSRRRIRSRPTAAMPKDLSIPPSARRLRSGWKVRARDQKGTGRTQRPRNRPPPGKESPPSR